MKLVAKDQAPSATGAPRHLGTAAIEACQPGEIIVVEQRSGIDAGSWGGILSLGAKVRGIAGVIADGPLRDVDEAREFDFPVYSRAVTARTARNRVAEAATDVPVQIGEITVQPGDYAIADSTGVCFLPAAQAARDRHRGGKHRDARGGDGQSPAARPAHHRGDGRQLREDAGEAK